MENLLEKKTCSICLRRIHNKTTIDCGHSFCGPCIMIYWAQQKKMTCPQCTGMIPGRHLKSNLDFKNFTELLKTLMVEEEGAPPEDTVICARHQEPLTFFCQIDMALICNTCKLSFEHRQHPALPIEAAAQHFKDPIKAKIRTLKTERNSNTAARLYAQADINACLEKLEEDMDLFTREFEQLRQFEEEQKGLFLSQLKLLQKELEEAKKSIADCFIEKFDYLSTQIRNNEELCQKTGIQFLQDLEKNFIRDASSSARPNVLPSGASFVTQRTWFLDDVKKSKPHSCNHDQNKEKSHELCQKHAAYSRRNRVFKKIMENFKAQVTSCIQRMPKPTVPIKKVPVNRSHLGIDDFDWTLREHRETFIPAEMVTSSHNADSSIEEVETLSDDDSSFIFEVEEMVTLPDDDISVVLDTAN